MFIKGIDTRPNFGKVNYNIAQFDPAVKIY